MSYSLPTLFDLTDRARKAFRTFMPGTDAYLWPNNIGPTAKVIAGAVFEAFGFVGYVAKQIFVSTAPDLDTLKLHGNEFGISLRPAYPAAGTAQINAGTTTVIASVGGVLQRSDGFQYIVGQDATIAAGGNAIVAITAAADGANGNVAAGEALAIVSGISGDATAVVAADVIGGSDVEDIESYRARILFRKRNPPHGGSAADYVIWAGSVIGVTRVFVERRWNGPGSVRVFPLMDDLYTNGIAPPDAIARVDNYIQSVAPAGAVVTTAAPVAVPVSITISGLTPNTVAVQEAILASLRDAFLRLSRVDGSDSNIGGMDYLAYPTTFSRSWLWQAVANATGEQRHTITSPSGDVTLTAGQIATLGTVTFA